MPNINNAQNIFFDLYPLQDIMLDHGKGCYLYDTMDKSYLDFAAGIAVAALGHAHPVFINSITKQANKMAICPASYMTEPRQACGRFLLEHSCFDRVYLCNSGTESVEAAFKLARKWAYESKGSNCNEIITFEHAFHGRTMAAASLTYKRDSQPFYAPYIEGIHTATFNNIESVKNLVSDKTAAIIIEPIQGEGGILPAKQAFLKELRTLCDTCNIALIFDEIQCGMGRTGKTFSYEHYGVEPDIITLAKGMGGGFPVGAMLAKNPIAKYFDTGAHGTTYGGNPLACAVALSVMKEILTQNMLDHVAQTGAYFIQKLEDLSLKYDQLEDVRGQGLMIGVDMNIPVSPFVKKLRQNGLMTTMAGDKTLRFTPPLIVTEEEINEALNILEKCLN